MNKPVAYFLKYKDETYIECPSSVVGAIPLYTHPVKELDIKYDVTVKWDDKTTHHTNVSGDTPLHHTHPAKELTQGEIHAVWASGQYYTLDKEGNVDEIRFEDFAKAILRKAQEK